MSHTEYKNFPKIAIIGRPNVGKSSIFNRILKRRKAIVEQTSGVTRDRLYARIEWGGINFILIDTGGIVPNPKEKIAHLVYKQSQEAIDEADAVIFVCEVSPGVTYQDEHIASLLKKIDKKAFLAVNKIDDVKLQSDAFEFYKLSLGKPYPISALHNKGFEELNQDIIGYISGIKKYQAKEDLAPGPLKEQSLLTPAIKIAVVGRPNVGKSSFINCLINQERLLVDETPGTTRDSVDIHIKRDKEPLVMVDTAGIRHKKKIKEVVEIFSLARAKQSIRRCDVALMMMEATAGLLRDDIAVIDYIIREGKNCVLLVNKRDLVEGLNIEDYKKTLRNRYKPLEWIPIIFTSCKQRSNIIKAVDIACEIAKKSRLNIPTVSLNELFKELQRFKAHPAYGKARPKIYYATQIATAPPTLLLFVTEPKHIKKEYLRFIEHRLRRRFGLNGIPLVLQLRAKS